MAKALNVLGGELKPCCFKPLTGFYRDGCCNTGPEDQGCHTICCVVTEDFLRFSKSKGNDLITPYPQYQFPGLKPGDKWCVCAGRWVEALNAGKACPIVLEATHQSMLEWVSLEILQEFAYRDPDPAAADGWSLESGDN